MRARPLGMDVPRALARPHLRVARMGLRKVGEVYANPVGEGQRREGGRAQVRRRSRVVALS